MSQNTFLLEEANRCLLCKNPRCSKHCPVNTSIPEVIELYKQGELKKAGEILFENNPLSAICALVCEHEKQCEGNCIRGIKSVPIPFYKMEEEISLKYLEELQFEKGAEDKERIAVIGGGPAGMTIALLLQRRGYKVTIFESRNQIGGVLRYGIPEYRLPKRIIDLLEKHLLNLGVKIRPNILIGPVLSLDKLFEDGYAAAFIGTGVWNPRTLGIKGESFGNVHFAIDYLKSPQFYSLGENVAVIGAGNVAMDAARTAIRLGAEVTVVYRRTEAEAPARLEEIEHAKEEGVKFSFLTNPVEIIPDEHGWVKKIRCIRMELGEPDEKGRRKPVEVPNSEFEIEADTVIISIGTSPNPLISQAIPGLELNRWKGIVTDEETGATNKEGIYAGGDAVTGAATVILAMGAGKKAAKAIDEMLNGK